MLAKEKDGQVKTVAPPSPLCKRNCFHCHHLPPHSHSFPRWETFLVIKFFPTGQWGGLDSTRRMHACESWYLSLCLTPLPPPSLHSASISLLCVVLLHQGTYDLWAHLSAIIKQSLMKSQKVTSWCTCAYARGTQHLTLTRARFISSGYISK